jgi:hypothetical protein
MNEQLMREMTEALRENTCAMQEHTAALHEATDTAKKLERTVHLIFEDKNGYVNSAADDKIRGLMKFADRMDDVAHRMDSASKRMADSGRR